jgi:hypothetical protein
MVTSWQVNWSGTGIVFIEEIRSQPEIVHMKSNNHVEGYEKKLVLYANNCKIKECFGTAQKNLISDLYLLVDFYL